MHDAVQFDDEMLGTLIENTFQQKQPDLYRHLINPPKETGLNLKLRGLQGILKQPRQKLAFTVPLPDIVDELLRLLDQDELKRSEPQRRLLTWPSLCTVLQRPQLCQGKEIQKSCGLHPTANLTVIRNELVANLKRCYGDSYVGIWIMFDKSPTNRTPFVPQFGNGPLRISIPPRCATRYHFEQDAYNDHLARAITAGNDVSVLTRTAKSITESSSVLEAIQSAPKSASLTVILLDSELALGDERIIIQNNWALLNGWKLSSVKAALNLHRHDRLMLDVEVALIGDNQVLQSPLTEARLVFGELRLGDPFFEQRKSQVLEALKSHPRVRP
jgi:hypothetical protein